MCRLFSSPRLSLSKTKKHTQLTSLVMSSKRGSAGESRMPSPHRKPTRSASSGGLAAPPSSPLPPQEVASTIAEAFFLLLLLERARSPFSLPPPEEDCFGYDNAEKVKG